MATSPIYNWPEPDNTDLVKNGALAMRTLGDAIDTTMATMTPKSIVDAKGDLIAASAADTPARLAVGNNGETLVADNSTSTGLRYNPQNALANPVINGGMDNWQRGTTFSVPGGNIPYTADRWQAITVASGNATISRQTINDSTNLPNIQYALRFQRDSGQTGTGNQGVFYSAETSNSIPLAGKTVTLSFYAKAGANYSGASNALSAGLRTGTGTDENNVTANGFTGYTGVLSPIIGTATLTTDYQRFAFTATLSSTLKEFGLRFFNNATGTAGANDWFEITGVQIDIGTYTASTAPSFRRSGGTIQGELAACQRYLPAIIGDANTILGFAYGTTGSQISIKFPVTARAKITGIVVNPTLASNYVLTNQGFGSGTPTAIAFNNGGTEYSTINVTTTAGSPTIAAGQPVQLSIINSGYILFTGAEL